MLIFPYQLRAENLLDSGCSIGMIFSSGFCAEGDFAHGGFLLDGVRLDGFLHVYSFFLVPVT